MRLFADPVATMLRLHQTYGEVAAVTRDNPGWVFAFGAQYNRQVLSDTQKFHNLADSPLPAPKGSAAETLNYHLVAQNGDTHREKRRLMMPAFAKARMAGYRDRADAVVARVVDGLPVGEVSDVRKMVFDLSLDAALSCLFGAEVGEDAEHLNEVSGRFLELILSPAAMIFPVNMRGTPYARYLEACAEFVAQIEGIIEVRKREGLGSDLLSALIAAEENGVRFSTHELLGHAGLLLSASHETTAVSAMWALLLMATHPEARERASAEVREEVGDGPLTGERLDRLVFLDRVLRESMRLLPGTAMFFFRRSQSPFALGDYELPSGSTVLLSPLVTHRDPHRYPDPQRFDPDRWENLEPGVYEYLPFGAGSRRCLGAGFAWQALKLILARVLRGGRFELIPNTRVDTRMTGIILNSKGPLPMRYAAHDSPIAPVPPLSGTIRNLVDLPS